MDMSETELVLQAKSGNKDAFGLLVSSYSRRIYQAAYSFMRNMDDSADIVQEVFIRAYKNIHSFDTSRPLYPWLFRITKNLCINMKNRGSSSEISLPEFDLPGDSESPESLLMKDQDAEQIRRSLKKLPDPFREILVLKHFQECSYAEIAEILSIPIGTVMSRLYNARKKMQEILIKEAS